MRVLQFGRFGDPSRGGIERHVSTLSKYLAAAGADVVNLVAAPEPKSSRRVVENYQLVEAASHGIVFSTAVSPSLLMQARKLHDEKSFDIAHLHFPDPLSHAAALLLPSSVKRVVTWHSDVVRQQRLLKLYSPFQRHFIERADAVIAGTPAHFTSSTQMVYDKLRMPVVIPYGLDYSTLTSTPHIEQEVNKLRSRYKGPLIFALGRHVYYKGFSVLIKAMKELNAHLILGGAGPLSTELRRQCSGLGLNDKITFVGRIPDSELPVYLHACDLFCMPSVEPSEAFGLVQLEAMACGKPVVCTQLGNGVNVVNQEGVTGLAVPPNDAAALAVAIRQLLQDSTLAKTLGSAGRQRAFEIYSAEVMASHHMSLYARLVA